MSLFLRYLVEATLEGRSEDLRERQIGIHVFDRPPDWDPKVDNVVRSEARRLRKKLEAFYESEGADDLIRIAIPAGGYAAVFSGGEPTAEPGPPSLAFGDTATAPEQDAVPSLPSNIQPAASEALQRIPRRLILLGTVILAISLAALRMIVIPAWNSGTESFRIVPFAAEAGMQFSPASSPDGKRIAYVWDENRNRFNIYVKEIASGKVVALTADDRRNLSPSWSPDGKRIAFLRKGDATSDVVVQDLFGGLPQVVAHVRSELGGWVCESNWASESDGPVWSPDGMHLLIADSVADGFGLTLLSTQTGERQVLTVPSGLSDDYFPRFSPDGRQIAFVRYFSHGVGEVFVLALDHSQPSGQPRQITFDHSGIRGLDWEPNGRQLVYSTNRSGPFQLRRIESTGGDSVLLNAPATSVAEFTVAKRDGWIAYVDQSASWSIRRAPIHSGLGKSELVASSSGLNHTPQPSPDGRRLAFVSDRSGSWQIWIDNFDGRPLVQLTHLADSGYIGGLSWSPEGSRISFDARIGNHSSIFVVPAAGGEPRRIDDSAFEERSSQWTADGCCIVYSSDRGGILTLWKTSLATHTTSEFSSAENRTLVQTSDGTSFFFTAPDGYLYQVSEGSKPSMISPSVRPASSVTWAATRDGIAFVSQSQPNVIFFYKFRDRQITKVGQLDSTLQDGAFMSVSRDGQWLYFVTEANRGSTISIRYAADAKARFPKR